jgi:hypothetical protein
MCVTEPFSRQAVFMTSLWWHTTSGNTIEGCVRAHTPHDAPFGESMLLSTGWEDYYISSWGMIQGPWQGELSGTTAWSSPQNRDVSAYVQARTLRAATSGVDPFPEKPHTQSHVH